ncbi:hypothetical protein [Pantoea anthophila]|uniref:hypothetical protein n=1 Tax=Pantoea anthophila TaxID=470931 RepID=UPI003AFB539A
MTILLRQPRPMRSTGHFLSEYEPKNSALSAVVIESHDDLFLRIASPMNGCPWPFQAGYMMPKNGDSESSRAEQNRTEQNRTEQNVTGKGLTDCFFISYYL